MSQTYVLKLGGSMVSPNKDCLFDFNYVKSLKEVLKKFVEAGDKFFVSVGGGNIMRQYRDLAMANGIEDTTGIHWIGTTVNVLNAQVSRVTFGEIADVEVYKFEEYYDESKLEINNGVKFGGGGRPGHSGDMDAVKAALKLNSKLIISLKNIDAIYTADPKKDVNAKPTEHLSWKGYMDIIGNPTEHTPGANFPIDPIASKDAMDNGMKFIVISGFDLENLTKVLNGEKFVGTTVE